jgi:alcohol dehydrogenase, propanol-preferring
VLGIGGLGHLAVQYARHMGFDVAAIARGSNTAELAKKLGAHHYIDSAVTDPAAALQALGGAKVILITASGGKTVAATFKGLRPGGALGPWDSPVFQLPRDRCGPVCLTPVTGRIRSLFK